MGRHQWYILYIVYIYVYIHTHTHTHTYIVYVYMCTTAASRCASTLPKSALNKGDAKYNLKNHFSLFL